MESGNGFTIQQQALQALEKSTKTLAVAYELLKQGNEIEGNRLRNEARSQRTISTLLLTKADHQSTGSTGVRSTPYSETFNFPGRAELP